MNYASSNSLLRYYVQTVIGVIIRFREQVRDFTVLKSKLNVASTKFTFLVVLTTDFDVKKCIFIYSDKSENSQVKVCAPYSQTRR